MTDYSFIDKWYGNLVPNNFDGLIEFTILSSQLTEDIYRLKPGVDLSANLAYVKNDICFLPAMYYLDKYYKNIYINKQDRINAAISIINGSQIHESIKIKDLGKGFSYEYKKSKILNTKQYKSVTANKNNEGLFYRCFVLIEELFCDAYCEYYHSNVYPFVDLMNKSLYNEKFSGNIISNIKIDNSHHLLTGFNMFRNWDNTSKPVELAKWSKFKEALEILTSAKNPELALNEKFNLAYDLYELIKKNTINESDSANEQSSKDVVEMIDNQSVIVQNDAFSENELLDVSKEFEHSVNNDEKIDVKLVDVNNYRPYYRLNDASEFEGFANYLKNARAEKQVSQFPKMYGNRILSNRLMYANVDGSIFGKKDSTRLIKGYPEIIFLLDFSGSMLGNGLFTRVIEVGKTIFYDLQQNNISCAFYGHTTDDKCLVVAIASHNMPLMELNKIEQTVNFEQAFIKATGVNCNENADGYALEFVAQRFTDKPGKKLVVVASDGCPSFRGRGRSVLYGGAKAENHVESVANIIRESNISVVALSLTESVVSTNDRIYGKEHNYQAFGQNLASNLKKIVKELVI